MHFPELLRLALLLMLVAMRLFVEEEYMERRAGRFYSYHELFMGMVE
jgi:hypothetical protein